MRRNLLLTAGLAPAYCVAARLGLMLAIGSGHISAAWLGAALAPAALITTISARSRRACAMCSNTTPPGTAAFRRLGKG